MARALPSRALRFDKAARKAFVDAFLAQRHAQESDVSSPEAVQAYFRDRDNAAVEFVEALERLLREVAMPVRSPDQSIRHVKATAAALAKAHNLVSEMTPQDLREVIIAAQRHLERQERVRINSAPKDANEQYRKESLAGFLEANHVKNDTVASWRRVREQGAAIDRLRRFGRGGLHASRDKTVDHRQLEDSATTIRELMSDLELLSAGCSQVEHTKPARVEGLIKPQSLLADGVVGVFAMHGVDPGGRKGFASKVLAEALALKNLPGSAPSLIEIAVKKNRRKTPQK